MTTMTERRVSGSATTAAGAAGLVVMWSSGFVGARLGTQEAAADTLLAWRYVVVAALVGVLVAVRRPRFGRGELTRQVMFGLLCQVGYLTGVVGGVGMGVPAGTAALIAVLQPMVVGTLAGPVLGEPVRARQWLGLGIGLAGVSVVVFDDLGAGGPPFGYLLVVGGMLSLSAGTLLERRWRQSTPLADAFAVHCLVAALAFVAAAGVAGRLAPPMTVDFWFAVAWVVVLSTFGGYGCYLLTPAPARRDRRQHIALSDPTHHDGVGEHYSKQADGPDFAVLRDVANGGRPDF